MMIENALTKRLRDDLLRNPPRKRYIQRREMSLNLGNISPLPLEVISFLQELSENEQVEKLIIFGSRACGDYDKYSDVDLAVVAPKYNRSDWILLRAKAIHDIRTVLKISIVNFVSNPLRLQNQIYKDGEVIYEQP